MKGTRYRKAVEIIAYNDEPLELDPQVIEEQITVALIADVFDLAPSEVAKDVIRARHIEAVNDRAARDAGEPDTIPSLED